MFKPFNIGDIVRLRSSWASADPFIIVDKDGAFFKVRFLQHFDSEAQWFHMNDFDPWENE